MDVTRENQALRKCIRGVAYLGKNELEQAQGLGTKNNELEDGWWPKIWWYA